MDRPDRTLPYGKADYKGQLTNDLCLSHCCSFLDDATFMGTEAGFQCYCSNVTNEVAFVVPRFEDTCNSPCDGNSSEICGGGWRLRCSDTTEAIYLLTANEIYTVTTHVNQNAEITTYPENIDSTPSWNPKITTRLEIGTDLFTTNNEYTEKPVKPSTSTFSTFSPTTGDIISANGRNVSLCFCAICLSKEHTFLTESELEKILVHLRNLILINKKDTNKYKRTKQSAYDSRKSSRYLGIGGVIVISLPVMFIVSIDVLNMLNVA
ncbi:unnamed protein product [Mytilus coruscus]|uniref:WSC domain-containing protein n=1 Tax=Mytilus coruscus TaxID=42192 RepID=A0A6J8AZW9_MYTCO|nr:unnamed protein product [Mytilus coruscus]